MPPNHRCILHQKTLSKTTPPLLFYSLRLRFLAAPGDPPKKSSKSRTTTPSTTPSSTPITTPRTPEGGIGKGERKNRERSSSLPLHPLPSTSPQSPPFSPPFSPPGPTAVGPTIRSTPSTSSSSTPTNYYIHGNMEVIFPHRQPDTDEEMIVTTLPLSFFPFNP